MKYKALDLILCRFWKNLRRGPRQKGQLSFLEPIYSVQRLNIFPIHSNPLPTNKPI